MAWAHDRSDGERPGAPRRPSSGGPRHAGRGQTSFDFLMGMSVFFIAVGFAIGFLPGMFDPFASDAGETMIVADRSATHLAEDALVVAPDRPGVLDPTCTAEFFDGGGGVGDCRFEADADDLHAALGIADTAFINVTIERTGSVRSVSSVPLSAGPPAGSTADVTVARRLVVIDGTESTLYVRVW